MKRKKRADVTLSFTSMTDMVFLLLTFFIIGTVFGNDTRLKINLPSSKTVQPTEKHEPKRIVIEVNQAGEIAMNGEIVTLEQLDVKLGELVQQEPDLISEHVVVLKADKAVEYGQVVKVLGICMSHNLYKLGMSALLENQNEPS